MILTEKTFSDYIYKQLEKLGYKITLSENTTESEFPCIEMHTPLKNVNKVVDGIPVSMTFQISLTCWHEYKRDCMEMASKIDNLLLTLNIIRTNSNDIIYDQVLMKNGMTVTYEVRYNGLTNSLELIR